MKPISREVRRCPAATRRPLTARLLPGLLAWTLLGLIPGSLLAGVPEPDNLLYGRITLDGQPVTAARSDVVVEARRAADQAVLARYRLGDDRRLGDFYRLRVPLESAAPLVTDQAVLAGEGLVVVAMAGVGPTVQALVTAGDRGRITRLDLGQADPDADRNGLADAWEQLHFGHTGVDPLADPDGDRRSNLREYLDGTDPRMAELHRLLSVSLLAGNRVRIEGLGLPGRTYSIQATTDLGGGNWQTVVQATAAGEGAFTVEHLLATPGTAWFFRSVEQ